MRRLLGLGAGAAAVIAFIIIAGAIPVNADPGAPAIPHAVTAGVPCLTCHGPQSAKPVPASHSSYNDSMCQACHSAAAPATPTTPATPAAKPAASQADSCLGCHSQPGLSITLPSGEKLSLYIDPTVFAGSIHGSKLVCTDCHSNITGFPHPKLTAQDARQLSVAQYELCKRCHFDNYTKTLDSVHYKMLSGGNLQAPLCTDCHGAHDVTAPSEPRSKISQTCSECHKDIYQSYASSVHGEAVIDGNNQDVPVCTDCHLSHTIVDPRTASFRLHSVQLCSDCHGNEAIMSKYGISTDVVRTYLQDFHGRTAALVGQQGDKAWVDEAVCTDCHGVHDIQKVTDADSPVIKANLLATCRKCHADATPNFPSAWLSHYEPSPTKAPLVFYARWFYKIMIPFVLVGLSVLILLDLWRTITNR